MLCQASCPASRLSSSPQARAACGLSTWLATTDPSGSRQLMLRDSTPSVHVPQAVKAQETAAQGSR